MRKFVSFILLASAAAAPALAAPADWSDRQQARAERQQAREQRNASSDQSDSSRPERAERPQRIERPERVERMVEPRARGIEAPPHIEAIGSPTPAEREAIRDARRQQAQPLRERRPFERPAIGPVAIPRDGAAIMRDRAEQRRQETQDRMAALRHARPPVISTTPRPGTQPPPPAVQRPSPPVQWSSNWRNDNRYDWNRHRHHHHSLFNLGFYYDPFGWGYQPYMIGWRMWPSYYGSNYWLNDPWQYRLPYAPAGYRWVRYWDDVVLVDMWSGQVVDVIYNFFW